MTTQRPDARDELMAEHVEARRRRDTADLDSAEYRAACEEISHLEAAISSLWEAAGAAKRAG